MKSRRAPVSLAFSLVVTLVLLHSSEGEAVSGGASGPTWVRPVKETIFVYTSSGPDVEKIGILTKDTVVQVLREHRGWYQIRFVKENAEFVGWVVKGEVTIEGTPPNPPERNPKPEPAPDPKKKPEPEEKTLSIQETHEKLMGLVEIQVGTSPVFKKQYNLSRMRTYRKETGSSGMALLTGGQKAKIVVLYLFDPDEVIEVFVEDRIRELKALQKEGHPAFSRTIDCYIRALEAYLEGKFPDLRRLIERAEDAWKRIPGVVVGF